MGALGPHDTALFIGLHVHMTTDPNDYTKLVVVDGGKDQQCILFSELHHSLKSATRTKKKEETHIFPKEVVQLLKYY